jgi:hypothetical protein
MRSVKKVILVMIAAGVVGALSASGALATEVYNNGVTLSAGSVLDISIKPGSSASLVSTAGETLDQCTTSTIKGKVTNAGSSTTTTTGTVEEMTFGNCTFPTKMITLGKLELHHVTGTTSGTLTADAEFAGTINTVFFGSCIYGVKVGTDIGLLTSGKSTGEVKDDPILHTNAIVVKMAGSAFACPETTRWTSTYVVTEPTGVVTIEQS